MTNRSILTVLVAVAAAVTVLLASMPVAAAADDITVEFMASGPFHWDDGSLTGHAFICVGLRVEQGLKEDCFGFYPKGSGLATVYGPGCTDSELNGRCKDHPITRFSNISVSVKKPITEDQRRAIYTLGTKWNAKQFTLGVRDCVAFANAIAGAAGLATPNSTAATAPATYVAELKRLNP